MDYYGPMTRLIRPLLVLFLGSTLLAHAQGASTRAALPVRSALNSELFYEILLGELKAREGEPGAGYSLVLDAARKTNDAKLYQRATDIALRARAGDSALASARAWKQAHPTSKQANGYVLQILVGMNRIVESLEPLKQEVSLADPKDRGSVMAGIAHHFSHVPDKKLAAAIVERALADYLGSQTLGAAAWAAVGRLRFEAGDIGGALEAINKGLAIDAKALPPALLAVAMMSPKTPQAEALVQARLNSQAQPELRMEYARALLEAKRYTEATAQLQALTAQSPERARAWLVLGVLQLQGGQWSDAEHALNRYVELVTTQSSATADTETRRGLTQAYLSLARIAEQKKDFAQAEQWLKRVDNPEDLLNAELRRAAMMARRGEVEQARQLIHAQVENSPEDARLKIEAEVQLLRDSEQFESAYDVLAQALAGTARDPDLMYEMAMLAEKIGRVTEMERLLRELIALKPDYQHAYNALGYSLAQRNMHLSEARQLILRALELAPGDPFISDSLGWVEFRSGNLGQAAQILETAFKARPDAEIAAHLGEVLWALGRQEQAMSVWREGIRLNASNETLQKTLKRLNVKL